MPPTGCSATKHEAGRDRRDPFGRAGGDGKTVRALSGDHADRGGGHESRFATPHYEIHVDRAHRCMRIRMLGHWTHAVFDGFAGDLHAAEAIMAGLPGVTHTLVDSRDFDVQDMMLIDRFGPLVNAFDLGEARRTAIVTRDPVARMQARRTGDIVNARYFRAVEHAEDWLFGDEA